MLKFLTINYLFISNIFMFPFILKKLPLQKAEDYIIQISEIKKAQTDTKKSYFDVTLQTETTVVCGVCFLPDKHER